EHAFAFVTAFLDILPLGNLIEFMWDTYDCDCKEDKIFINDKDIIWVEYVTE
ncbi:33379_t:CDS:2, partial [Racocetra persica]